MTWRVVLCVQVWRINRPFSRHICGTRMNRQIQFGRQFRLLADDQVSQNNRTLNCLGIHGILAISAVTAFAARTNVCIHYAYIRHSMKIRQYVVRYSQIIRWHQPTVAAWHGACRAYYRLYHLTVRSENKSWIHTQVTFHKDLHRDFEEIVSGTGIWSTIPKNVLILGRACQL